MSDLIEGATLVRSINVRQLADGTWKASVFSLNEPTKYFYEKTEEQLYKTLAKILPNV